MWTVKGNRTFSDEEKLLCGIRKDEYITESCSGFCSVLFSSFSPNTRIELGEQAFIAYWLFSKSINSADVSYISRLQGTVLKLLLN